jgi:hypothetical protein
MPTYTPSQLFKGQLSNPTATRYTSAATTIIKEFVLHNAGAGARIVTIYIVESGDTAGADDQFFLRSLAANETYLLDLSMVMKAGDFISMGQDAGTDVTATISGILVT